MRKRTSLALTLGTMLLGGALLAEPQVRVLSQFTWDPNVAELCKPTNGAKRVSCIGSYNSSKDAARFGGLSGLEVDAHGQQFVSVSDTGVLSIAMFERGSRNEVISARLLSIEELKFEDGQRPEHKLNRDTEGLALSFDGNIYVSAESNTRMLKYEMGADIPTVLALPELGPQVPTNMGFEALAISSDDTLVAVAEGSKNIKAPFQVFHRNPDGEWSVIYELPRRGGFRPVGADFGPDGHLYILTRSFIGFAFASRIERILFENKMPIRHEDIYQSRLGQFDNLEGLATWRAGPNDLRLYAVSDDNFSSLQTTQIIEFALQE